MQLGRGQGPREPRRAAPAIAAILLLAGCSADEGDPPVRSETLGPSGTPQAQPQSQTSTPQASTSATSPVSSAPTAAASSSVASRSSASSTSSPAGSPTSPRPRADRQYGPEDDGSIVTLRVGETAELVVDEPTAAEPTVEGTAVEVIAVVNVTGSDHREWEIRAVRVGRTILSGDEPEPWSLTFRVID